ncbi:MAG: LysR substrate-binding domain-containing protein [Paracoccaceae bacterium]
MEWKAAPSLSALRAFEAAARNRSLSRAAAELNVTHAAIAQHIRTVEQHLGTSLMHRAGRGMELTEDGARLLLPLTEAFETIITACKEVDSARQSGPLKITVTPSFAEYWLMPRLGWFWTSWPDVPVSITPSHALADLRRDGFDLAIRFGTGDWPGLETDFLMPVDYVIVGAPALVGDRRFDTPSDYTAMPWLIETAHEEVLYWAQSNGFDLADLNPRALPSMELVITAARAANGLAMVPSALVREDLDRGSLVALMSVPQEGLGYFLITLPGPQRPALRTFIKWIKDSVAERS